MTFAHLRRTLLVAVFGCLISTGTAAAPTPPGGSEPPSDHDPCENYAIYASLNGDVDRDGLSGYQECQLGTDINNSDTDNDFLADGEELSIGTDPTNWDTDGDQLEDCWEYETFLGGWPTDPVLAGPDTDGDLLADDLEIYKGLDPYDFDTDGDMLSDGEEVLPRFCGVKGDTFANAADLDRDDDGLVDGVEVNSLGTKPNLEDTDGDGYGDEGLCCPAPAVAACCCDSAPGAGDGSAGCRIDKGPDADCPPCVYRSGDGGEFVSCRAGSYDCCGPDRPFPDCCFGRQCPGSTCLTDCLA